MKFRIPKSVGVIVAATALASWLTPGAVWANNCPGIVIHGTLGDGSPDYGSVSGLQTGRLNRNGIASSCNVPKTCNIFDSANSRAYDAYRFPNSTGSPKCVSVNLDVTSQSGANYQSNAYLFPYDPANICLDYLADPGLSSGVPPTPTNFSFVAPASPDFLVVVHTTNPGEIGGDYTLTLTDTVAPTVHLVRPSFDQNGLPPVSYPIDVSFTSADNPGVTHEVVALRGNGTQNCVLFDGDIFGDKDRLLSDERLQINKTILCQAMARCGFNTLFSPRVVVLATDCEGNTGSDSKIIRLRLSKLEACSWP